MTDGNALWQLRTELGDEVEDRRSQHPDLPNPSSLRELQEQLRELGCARSEPPASVLAGLDAATPDFAIIAGERLASALALLPGEERVSLGQVLQPADEDLLLDWLHTAAQRAESDQAAGGALSPNLRQALTILAAFVAVLHQRCKADDPVWPSILEACGDGTRPWLFNTQDHIRRHLTFAFVHLAAHLRLRQAFAFRADPWSTLLALQAGLLAGDLETLPRWLGSGVPPVGLRHLIAPGPNHSHTMACTWHALQAYRRRSLTRDGIELLIRHSEWWPGWTADVACQACVTSVSYRRPDTSIGWSDGADEGVGTEAREYVAVAASSGGVLAVAAGLAATVGASGTATQRGRQRDARPLGDLRSFLLGDASAFALELPERLNVSSGPVSLAGDGFRLGGHVGEDGAVRWHAQEKAILLPLRGPSERLIRLERAGDVLETRPERLWQPDDYMLAFPLSGTGEGFDPFVFSLPRGTGVALLLHRTLQISRPADEERSLDGECVLHVFWRGIPAGSTVSSDGEVVWTAEQEAEARRVLPDVEVQLALAGGSARWGAPADLLMSGGPPGFLPRKAVVGAQMALAGQGPPWKFTGFALLPGAELLRRHGRVDGELNGERASVRASVYIANAPFGAALRDAAGWHPLDQEASFDAARDGACRLWASLPDVGQTPEWTVFEGPRRVRPYASQGVRLDRELFGFGEPLWLQSDPVNLTGGTLGLAAHVTDAGHIAGCAIKDDAVHVRLRTPVGWSPTHKVLAWNAGAVLTLAPASEARAPSDHWIFALPDGPLAGVCLFHGGAWLGSGTLAEDPALALRALLAGEQEWPDRLALAIRARLPVLAREVLPAVASRLAQDGGKGLRLLCSLPNDGRHAHLLGRLLEGWNPEGKLAEAVVTQFRRNLVQDAKQPTILDRLAADAPCAAIAVLALGIQPLANQERASVLAAVAWRLLPTDIRAALAGKPAEEIAAAAEESLLEKAIAAARCDRQFLAARDVGIAARAWATTVNATTYLPNLATAMTVAAVRRWLTVQMLGELRARLC